MKIIFMGTPSYATVIFEKLLNANYDIVALFTQPDKKFGRKQILTSPHIKQFCIENGLSLPIYQPKNLKEMNIKDDIVKLEPDFIVVAAYGQILPKNILDIAPCINLHASLLPKYRGASPIQSALFNEDVYTGVTSMLIEEGLDSGDILGFKYINIESTANAQELFDKLSIVAAQLIIDTITLFHNICPKKQNKLEVSYCKKIKRNDGLIVFDDANKIYQKFKAYNFWPGIFLESGLKIKECNMCEKTSVNKAGEIIEINKNYILVGCSMGILQITTVQPVSKKPMDVVDFIRGERKQVGDILI
ncbi:Methionyl-tRNA formyltransferase [hydrothermal vent metagenome]|uniref:methionyl-tRNA formyltransferase n=1 Tax=hydrothermal vent metagenome TaxID=652676 RepID=A0A3B1DXR3_9ZZZZ